MSTYERYQSTANPKREPPPVRVVRPFEGLVLVRAVPTAAGKVMAADIARYPKSWRESETNLTASRAELLRVLVQAGELTSDDPGMDEQGVQLDLMVLRSTGYADVIWG